MGENELSGFDAGMNVSSSKYMVLYGRMNAGFLFCPEIISMFLSCWLLCVLLSLFCFTVQSLSFSFSCMQLWSWRDEGQPNAS